MRSEGRSSNTQLTVLTEGSETVLFQSYFSDWPDKAEIKLYEEGRGKVAGVQKVSKSKDDAICPFFDCLMSICTFSYIQAPRL